MEYLSIKLNTLFINLKRSFTIYIITNDVCLLSAGDKKLSRDSKGSDKDLDL